MAWGIWLWKGSHCEIKGPWFCKAFLWLSISFYGVDNWLFGLVKGKVSSNQAKEKWCENPANIIYHNIKTSDLYLPPHPTHRLFQNFSAKIFLSTNYAPILHQDSISFHLSHQAPLKVMCHFYNIKSDM